MTSSALLIKQARHGAGLTQAELARRLKVTQPVIARLEREGANPQLLTLDRVIAATGHSLELGLAPASGVDETMIAANLSLEPAERLRHFAQAYRNVSEMMRTVRATDGP